MKHNKKYTLAMSLSILCLVLICVLLPTVKPIIQQNNVRYIVDAGHGLPDGGAVGVDGTTEQTLSLQISQKLYALFAENDAIMTRSGEQGLSIVDGSIREKKISDMKQRVDIAQNHQNALLISIHMNTYPDASVHGCQVFYRTGDTVSEQIANELQENINSSLQPDNAKTVKTISDNLYLFKNTTNSAILIECGFITNSEELNKLKSEDYQNKLAQLIYDSLEQ